MHDHPTRLRESADAVARLGLDFSAFSDDALLEAQLLVAEHDRTVDVFSVALAGEVARRSSPQLGYAGLAVRLGFVSPEALIQSVTGGYRVEAARHVAVGSALHTPVGAAVLAGTISVDAADAIQRGLGATDDTAAPLIEAAANLDTDQLLKRARDLKDELDAEAVERREKEQRDLRYLKYSKRDDGMVRGSFLLDALDGALVTEALNAVLSPRRGGPRMVDPEQKARDAALEMDPRSNEQIAADALVAMVRLAMDADPGTLFGSRRPGVRVVVGERPLAAREGAGRLEDGGEAVSMATIERLICDTGVIGIAFDDDGQCMNVGRTQRLFTQRQRIALAVRDGGCRVGNCDRPPSWCEAHHIKHWHRDQGKTDVADGILLCRRHHLLFHNNRWEITRDADGYWLTPPREIDPTQTRIPMPTKARSLEKRAS